ncbi:MAG: DUF6089 family protein [Bacteroidota bacterium]
MKRLVAPFFLICFLLTMADAYGQLSKRRIRQNNKRIRNFRGQKNAFSTDKKYNWVALTVNAFNYFGDLAPLDKFASTDISFTRPGVGVMFGHRFGPRYALRGSFTWGTIRGDDFESADPNDSEARFRYVRNLQFRNRIKELAVTAAFDLFKNEGSYISRLQFTPYVYAGLAVFHHNPQAFVNDDSTLPEAGSWVDLEPLGTEGQYSDLPDDAVNAGIEPYSLIQLAIPVGIGFRYRLNQVFDISAEFGVRYTFTDYLDDVSANYVDRSLLSEGLARELADRSFERTAAESSTERDFDLINSITTLDPSQEFYNGYGSEGFSNNRGNSDDNDVYFVSSIKLAYIIGATFRRAKFR